MLRSIDRYVPAASVLQLRQDDVTVLTAARTGECHTLSSTGEEVWTLLNSERQTMDRLVMALARRSSVYALAEVPDLVREQLERISDPARQLRAAKRHISRDDEGALPVLEPQ